MSPYKRIMLLILIVGSCLSPLPGRVEGQVTGAISKARTSHVIDSYGWYHVFGQVENASATAIIQVTTTFTSGYSFLASVTSYTMLDLVQASENASFNIILANATLSSSPNIDYNFAINFNPMAGNVPYRSPQLQTAQTSNFTDGSGHFHVVGTVTNNIGTTATFVEVIATFYTDTWVVAAADWAYSNPLNITAGGSGTFEIVALNTTRITKVRLQAQCAQFQTSVIADYALKVVPPLTKSVAQGGTITYDIRTTPNSILTSSSLTPSATGLPPGATASFSPPTVQNASRESRITLNVTTSSVFGVGIGSFLIIIGAQSGTAAHAVPVILTVTAVVDFELTVSPSSSSVSQGNQATYTVTARSGGGFSSAVTLNYSNIPTGSTASFDSNPIVPTSTGATTTFRISTSLSTETTTKIFAVCGSGGSPVKSHCASASVTVTASTAPRFTLSVDPASRTVMRSSFTTFTVTVGSVNNFNSPVSLSPSGLPAGTTGVFSPSTVIPSLNGTVQSTLNITTTSDPAYGTYTITITGSSSGYTSQSAQVTLIVSSLTEPDFAVYLLPAALSIVRNNSGTTTIQIVSINGFDGSVALTLENIPTGVSHAITNPTVAPLAGGYVYTKLTLQATSSSKTGSYKLTLKGTASSKTHTADLTLQITNRTSIGRCIVATATYGSEFSPEVQFLREFRDGRVLSTSTGKEFMKAFDAWYYSFSPQLASWMVTSPPTREMARVFLAPLLGILHLSEISYSALGFAPEVAVTLAGLIASSLIGVVYFGPILAIGYRRISRRSYVRLLVWVGLACVTSLLLLSIGLLLFVSPLVMLASSTLVLSTMTLGSLLVPLTVSSMLRLR